MSGVSFRRAPRHHRADRLTMRFLEKLFCIGLLLRDSTTAPAKKSRETYRAHLLVPAVRDGVHTAMVPVETVHPHIGTEARLALSTKS